MIGKPKENIEPTTGTAGKIVATASKINQTVYDVKPTETISIVADNRVLFIGKGLKHISTE